MTANSNGWEPDPRSVGKNWRSMFESPPRGGEPSPSPPPIETDDAELFDAAEYRPWTMGRGGLSMMLHLRRFDPKARIWTGWLLPYSGLYALEYVGNTVSLDFGSRQFIIEGSGLEGLVHLVQQSALQAATEFSADAWPRPSEGPLISAIKRLPPPAA